MWPVKMPYGASGDTNDLPSARDAANTTRPLDWMSLRNDSANAVSSRSLLRRGMLPDRG